MGVISVGASLGVAERGATRAPSVSPLAAPAASPSSSSSAPTAAAPTAPTATSHRRQHEFPGQHAPTAGGRPHKRGGRRKYAQSNHAAAVQFPPPPIVTAAAALATPSPAARAGGGSCASSAPSSPAPVARVVTFETNVDAQLLVPFVLGARGGSRLQVFMQQSKATIAHHVGAVDCATETVSIPVNPIANVTPTPSSPNDRQVSFVVTAESTKRFDHAVRLLQGAIETAEQILVRKKLWTPAPAEAVVATTVAVDSGGNGKPSSGHASASRAVLSDHSIDDPPPPSSLSSASSSSAPSTSHVLDVGSSHDSVDERKAQTRIRYPPTNQPLKRGPGFAPSRSIVEASTTVTASLSETQTSGVVTATSRKRECSNVVSVGFAVTYSSSSLNALPGQFPSTGEESIRCDSHKRERITSDASQLGAPHEELNCREDNVHPDSTDQHSGVDDDVNADPEFDEFRIRLTRGIEFAREVDAEAARVKQRMIREKKKYLQMIQQSQMMKHQQRVADVVIRTQCAIMATVESSGRKRRRIEQLSAAQDALQKNLFFNQLKMPSHMLQCKRLSLLTIPTSHPMSSAKSSNETSELMKRVTAFRAAVSNKNSVTKDEMQPTLLVNESSEDRMVQNSTISNEAPEVDAIQRSERNKQKDVFRPRHLAPGVLRDMNLIQDYTDESDCALLRLLIGQRQYFYLEPIGLSYGASDLDRLQLEALRTTTDVDVMHEFLVKRRRFGVELLKAVESVSLSASQALASSKTPSWTLMQRSLLELHPLLLVLHLLAIHYHAVIVLDQKKVISKLSKPDLLSSEDELSSDLFKFVLRPIRSSAIESSLNDSLPISLVRETIAHCPEVVNHVLDWKEETDVPPLLLQDVKGNVSRKDKSSNSSAGSAVLAETLKHLERHASDFDRNLSELTRHLQGVRSGTVSGDKVVHLVNQLKALGAQLLVANTQLQLHKWASVFVENGFSWFDDDMDGDVNADNVVGCDRSYDKFTCLQDALYVWHNVKLKYSNKDESCDDASTTVNNGALRDDIVEPESEEALDHANHEQEDVELDKLRRVTPADVLNIVETQFTDTQSVASFYLTSRAIADIRKEFNDSLASMRASMKVLGRTAPWRTHVKHSNSLKIEYTKQRQLENKLLLHQWAAYYKSRPLPVGFDSACGSHEDGRLGNDSVNGNSDTSEVVEEAAITNDITSNPAESIADTGIVLEPGDTPEVVDMKLLRHEIENVAKQMHSMGDTSAVDADRKKLLDACNLLAASCVSALTKFLNHDEQSKSADFSKTEHLPRGGRNRANSASKGDNRDRDQATSEPTTSRTQAKSRQRSKGHASDEIGQITPDAQKNLTDENDSGAGPSDADPKSQTAASSKRSKKGSSMATTRRARAHSTSSASPRTPPAVAATPVVPPLPSRASASKVVTSHSGTITPLLAEPLRMGCSGCRDTRRRCTGCHGCCLHCVCVGCGCRMCCSSRTSAVQKTLSLLLTAVETRMGCKWIELDSIGDHSERCGMVKVCDMCQQCSSHCKCHPSAQAPHRDEELASQPLGFSTGSTAPATAGFPSAATRKERRFRINPTAAQRRQAHSSGGSDEDTKRRPTSAGTGHSAAKRTRRSNSDATPSMFKDDSMDSTTGSDFFSSDQFSGTSTDGNPFASGKPLPAQHKSEQEDLFRAARVRMKLQRSTFMKPSHPYGLIPPNTLIEGEMLWHPDRIRLMWERKDVYGVLGVPREASSQLIKKQYRRLVLKLHPDKVPGTNEAADMTSPKHGETWSLDDRVSAFVAVTQAYKLLSGEIGAIHNNAWKTPATTL